MSYQEAMEAAGAKVINFWSFGSYQGEWVAQVEYEGRTGFVSGHYGSCSGCDAFEAEFGYDAEKSTDYQERLADFGRGYLVYNQKTNVTQAEQVPERHDYHYTAGGNNGAAVVIVQDSKWGNDLSRETMEAYALGRVVQECPDCTNITATIRELEKGDADRFPRAETVERRYFVKSEPDCQYIPYAKAGHITYKDVAYCDYGTQETTGWQTVEVSATH